MQTRDRYVVYGENKRFATLLDVAGKRGLDLQEAGGEDEVEEREDEQDALRLPYGTRQQDLIATCLRCGRDCQ